MGLFRVGDTGIEPGVRQVRPFLALADHIAHGLRDRLVTAARRVLVAHRRGHGGVPETGLKLGQGCDLLRGCGAREMAKVVPPEGGQSNGLPGTVPRLVEATGLHVSASSCAREQNPSNFSGIVSTVPQTSERMRRRDSHVPDSGFALWVANDRLTAHMNHGPPYPDRNRGPVVIERDILAPQFCGLPEPAVRTMH